MTRNGPVTDVNRRFVAVVRREWLLRLARALPRSVLDKRWPPAPPPCTEASELLRPIHHTWLMRKYVRNLKPARKYAFQQKVLAEKLFKGESTLQLHCLMEPGVAVLVTSRLHVLAYGRGAVL